MQQQHPVICQHSIWGSKQQRYRHCKLPAKLSSTLLDQLKQLELKCFPTPPPTTSTTFQSTEEEHAAKVSEYLALRTAILQPLLDAHQILCGHHQKEALAAQLKQDEISKAKAEGTYQDPEELRRLSKEQPVDPKDIPGEFLEAIGRVFSGSGDSGLSDWVKRVLDRADGPEEWKVGGRSGEEEEKEEFPCHESYERLFSEAGAKKKRHLAQESQLIQSMSTLGLLKPVLDLDQDREVSEVRRKPVFVEFGAGTGGLSRHLQLVLETIVNPSASAPSSPLPTTTPSETTSGDQQDAVRAIPATMTEPFNFVLLDRQKFRSRNQVDYMIRTQPRPVKPRVLRITKDVRELTLENLQLIHEVEPGVAWPDWTEGGGGEIKPKEATTRVPTHYMCISKHFCGPATDLALSWMREQRERKREEGEPQDLYSICFATCCHGICEPSLVVTKQYLTELLNSPLSPSGSIKKRKRIESEELDVNMVDKQTGNATTTDAAEQPSTPELVSDEQLEAWIPWIIKLTGWATLGKEEESSLVARPGKDASLAAEEVMTRNQRRVLGKRCKKLLDMARCMYLMRECGFREAKSIEYTTESVESGAIVGTM
ncbi:hypothetical protein EC991_008828 [Linnemannia zychae]|nr:hypothetical protein EC991_008828 [Linnemannia zychae]